MKELIDEWVKENDPSKRDEVMGKILLGLSDKLDEIQKNTEIIIARAITAEEGNPI